MVRGVLSRTNEFVNSGNGASLAYRPPAIVSTGPPFRPRWKPRSLDRGAVRLSDRGRLPVRVPGHTVSEWQRTG
ncbi:MAG: hypothetical protein D6725_08575 [Planctomycetota bacterium]|nr:MAG: hypothetical protein D6725_08575 [Planctomycetota bacterium]